MPNYKLTYFDARARGEPSRMLFHLVGQKYEDIRYDYEGEEWPKIKGDRKRFPLGQLPVLDVDGKLLTQSRAIYRFIARQFPGDYYGKNNVESSRIDEILGIVADIEIAITPAFESTDATKRISDKVFKNLKIGDVRRRYKTNLAFDPRLGSFSGRDEAEHVKCRDSTMKPSWDFFSESLQKAGGKYFIGNRLTLADLVIFNIIDFFLDTSVGLKTYFQPYPTLVKFYESIKNDSPLTQYLKDRKYTKY